MSIMSDIGSRRNVSYFLRYTFLSAFILFICGGIVISGSTAKVVVAKANTGNTRYLAPASCPSPAAPTSKSLLVVILDRSGSLASTDPNQYSTSVTKVLADLWPGSMAVVLMSGGGDALQYLGPENLSNNDARKRLKDEIEQQRNQLGAFTPLEAAMNKAYGLLGDANFPAGSRVILITDGEPSILSDPNGTTQAANIRNTLIPEFCSQGIQVNAFGLTIQDPKANGLLQDITDQTGGATTMPYQNVTNPQGLAKPVIQLYSQWRGLEFVPVTQQNGDFGVNVDTYARRVDFIAFRSNDSYTVRLTGPNGTPVSPDALQQTAKDQHYEFASLPVGQFNEAGTYTVNVGGDSNAQVYALSDSRLQLQIVAPTSQTTAHDGEPLSIVVALYDQNDPNNHIHPKPGDAVIGVTCTLQVNGKTVSCGEETLNQEAKPNDDLFSNQITLKQIGTVTLRFYATYQQIPVAAGKSISLPVQEAPCGANVGCYMQRYPLLLAIGLPILLVLLALLVAWLIWRQQPAPIGTLRTPPVPVRFRRRQDDDEDEEVAVSLARVEAARPLKKRIFERSLLASSEIQSYRGAKGLFDFGMASFELVFKRGQAEIKAGPGVPIFIKDDQGTTKLESGDSKELENESTIFIENRDRAIFSKR